MDSPAFDLIVRNGTIVDGSGGAPFAGDVAIRAGKIVSVGTVLEDGVEEFDAAGRIVAPGFVDIHTHYDGQVTWENRLSPSSGHGVTTVVMGNCGVGFAPCRAGDHDRLINVMEGVEDIPEVVMKAGIPWTWETFPEFLDLLETRACDVDFATQVPHSALRVYVMGERGADLEPPTDADLDQMTALVAEAVEAGALGVSTSRSINHRRADGRPAPSVTTEEDELQALARGLQATGAGVFQIIPNPTADPVAEFGVIRRLAETSARPVSFSLMDWPGMPMAWRTYLDEMEQARKDGLTIRAQAYPRPIGALFGLDLSYHSFVHSASFQPFRYLPLAEKISAMRDPELRAKLLNELPVIPHPAINEMIRRFDGMYLLTDPPVYDPPPGHSIAARAEMKGVAPLEYVYDLMIETEGRAIFYYPGANFTDNSLDHVREMITHDDAIMGLGDGGAHYGIICDSSFPTFTLAHWVRDAPASERLDLPWAIAALSRKTALAVGLADRGLIAPGCKADINVIDMDRLRLRAPHPVRDLPGNGRRLIQEAEGYAATIVSGQITYRDGKATGALPGKLVRRGA